MLHTGKFVVIAVLAVAVAVAVGVVFLNVRNAQPALKLWGADAAALIRNAPVVEAIAVATPTDKAQPTLVGPGGATFAIVAEKSIGKMPDTVYLRKAFLNGAFYEPAPAATCEAQWTHVLRFRNGEATATLWLDTHCQRVLLLETSAETGLNKGLLHSICERNLDPLLKPATKPSAKDKP